MIEKLDKRMEFVEISVLGNKKAECLDFEAGRKLNLKINELVDAVNELQNRIDPPSVYQVMKDKDAIIGKHIGEKQRLQDELERTRKENEDKQAVLNCVVDMLKILNQKYTLIMGKDVIKETVRLLEQNKGGDNE